MLANISLNIFLSTVVTLKVRGICSVKHSHKFVYFPSVSFYFHYVKGTLKSPEHITQDDFVKHIFEITAHTIPKLYYVLQFLFCTFTILIIIQT